MSGFVIGLVCLAIAGAIVSYLLYAVFKSKTGSTISAFIDQATLLSALTPVWLLAKKRGDTVILGLLAQVRAEASKWDDDIPPVPTPTPAQTATTDANTATLASLQATLASIQAQLAMPK